jgi:hypothetical protein
VVQVQDGGTQRAVANARVSLSDSHTKAVQGFTADDGKVIFDRLPLGTYSIRADKAGYSPGMFGQISAGSSALDFDLVDLSRAASVSVKIFRLGEIGGNVVDSSGKSVPSAFVRVFRVLYELGGRQLQHVQTTNLDADGNFKFRGLRAGNYEVAVVAKSRSSTFAFPVTYYPNAETPARGKVIELSGGATEFLGFVLTSNTSTSLAGTVRDQSGKAISAPVRLFVAGPGASPIDPEVMRTTSSAAGVFRFDGISPGSYTLKVISYPTPDDPTSGKRIQGQGPYFGNDPLPPTPTKETDWAQVDCEALPDKETQVPILIQQGFYLSGHLEVDTSAKMPPASELLSRPVVVAPLDGRDIGNVPVSRFEADGTFRTVGLPPGVFVLGLVAGFKDLFLQSVSVNGRDVTGRPFDLVRNETGVVIKLASHPTVINGAVQLPDGRQAGGASVIVFPADRSLWRSGPSHLDMRFYAIRTSSSGVFSMNVFPGSYSVVALQGPLPEDWQRIDFLDQVFPSGTPLKVPAGVATSINLHAHNLPQVHR